MPVDFSSDRSADFLVIGSMKCGTTTLYHDLRAQPSIFLPDKESNFLLGGAGNFDAGTTDQLCGEVCPDYAKLPQIDGVAERAFEKWPSAKIVFVVRNPIERAISHHHFVSSQKPPQNPGMSRNFEAALEKFPELIDFGRYGFQLEAWAKHYPMNQILVIRFEDFVSDRAKSLAEIFKFLGAEFDSKLIDEKSAHNSSANRPVLNAFWKTIRENPIYRRMVRPFTNLEMRNRIRDKILPRSDGRPEPPKPETIEAMKVVFREDLEQLRRMLGDEKPLWKL